CPPPPNTASTPSTHSPNCSPPDPGSHQTPPHQPNHPTGPAPPPARRRAVYRHAHHLNSYPSACCLEDVRSGEPGADLRWVEVAGDCAVAFDGYDGVDVDGTVVDLAGAGHLGGQVVPGDDVLGGVARWHGRDGEPVHGADQGDDGAAGDPALLGLAAERLHQFVVADSDNVQHGSFSGVAG